MTGAVYRIGMFGGGVVGGGVYELLSKLAVPTKKRIEVVQICVRDLGKPRDFTVDPTKTALTTNPEDILSSQLDCVVEVMGGTGLAKTVVERALRSGASVVTANKALLAQELDHLSHLSTTHDASLAYEAAVCGGIPVIHVLQSSYAGDVIRSVSGICNGTTNYMLGKMEGGYDYSNALQEAQDLGYAEADPTADVEGHDVMAKICLLAKLAFGTTVPVDKVPCKGISKITSDDFKNAAHLQYTIKLLGTASCRTDGDNNKVVSVYVTPTMVPAVHVLASARGPGNAVLVDSQNMGVCAYTGPGAGRYPTANSVVADIVRLANAEDNASAMPPFPIQTNLPLDMDYTGTFYVRSAERDADIEAAAEQCGFRMKRLYDGFCFTDENVKHSQVQAFAEKVNAPLFMPVLS